MGSLVRTGLILAIIACATQHRQDALASPILLLDTGTNTNNFAFRPQQGFEGFGQGVSVATTTQLDHFDLMFQAGGTGVVKFMIWDGTNTNLLYSQTVNVSTSNTLAVWVSSPTLSITLNAGSTYYFAVIPNATTTLAAPTWFLPSFGISQNGLTALKAKNSNYTNFASPSSVGSGSVTFPIRLFGTQNPPEPPAPDPPAPDPTPAQPAAVVMPEPSSIWIWMLALVPALVLRYARRGVAG